MEATIPNLNAEMFAQPNLELAETLRALSATFYDQAVAALSEALPEMPALTFDALFTEGMDCEQVWAQLELGVSEITAALEAVAPAEGALDDEDDYSDNNNDYDDENSEQEEYEGSSEGSGVTDGEYDEGEEGEIIVEGESQPEPETGNDGSNSEFNSMVDSDLAALVGDDSVPEGWMGNEEDLAQYADELDGDDDDSDVDLGQSLGGDRLARSKHKQEVEARKNAVAEHEQALTADAEWYMRGEAGAADRDADALIDVELEFDRGTRAAPPVNSEWTVSLERMLRRRITEKQYDDPVRLPPPDEATVDARRREAELAAAAARLGERPNQSLAEIYEAQHNEAAAAARGALTEAEKKVALMRAQAREMFTIVINELDSLANLSYTPTAISTAALDSGDVRVLRAAASGVAAADTEVSAPTAGTYTIAEAAQAGTGKRLGAQAVASHAERTQSEKKAAHERAARRGHRDRAEKAQKLATATRLVEAGSQSTAVMRTAQLAAQRAVASGKLANVTVAETGDKADYHRKAGAAWDAARKTQGN